MSAVLGVDLGGSSIRGAWCGSEGELVARELGSGPAPRSDAELVDAVAALADQADQASADITRIGLTVPGLVVGSVSRWVPNLPYLDGVDLASLLAPLGHPVAVGQDAQLSMLAEAIAGAAQGVRDAVMIVIGTGIGSAVLAGGRILRGSGGAACCFGWYCADRADPGEDGAGWLERQVSGRALDRLARSHGLATDGAGLLALAGSGDPAAAGLVDGAGQVLGVALAAAVSLLAPEVVLIGGGVAAGFDVIAPAVRSAMDRRLPPHLRGTRVRAAHFGTRAGLHGALAAARAGCRWAEVAG